MGCALSVIKRIEMPCVIRVTVIREALMWANEDAMRIMLKRGVEQFVIFIRLRVFC